MSLVTHIPAKPARGAVLRARPLHDLRRRMRVALGSRLGARYVAGIGGKVHFNDFQLASTAPDEVAHYRRDASDSVAVLGRALRAAGRDWHDIWACLDVGCGYGRVVRELCHEIPQCAISVCDLNEEGARFTAREFQARLLPIVELMGPERNGAFDLVYMFDLYTHLDRPMIELNLARVAEVTRRGGVVVFTTRGEVSNPALDADLAASGFAHRRVSADEGESWITPDTMQALVAEIAPSLAFIAHYPTAIGDQDVFVYQKR